MPCFIALGCVLYVGAAVIFAPDNGNPYPIASSLVDCKYCVCFFFAKMRNTHKKIKPNKTKTNSKDNNWWCVFVLSDNSCEAQTKADRDAFFYTGFTCFVCVLFVFCLQIYCEFAK